MHLARDTTILKAEHKTSTLDNMEVKTVLEQKRATQTNWKNKAKSIPDTRVRFEAHQYNCYDVETNVFHTPEEIIAAPNYKEFYYRITPFLQTKRGKVKETHFGVSVSNEYSNRFDMGDYWNQLLNELIARLSRNDDILFCFNSNLSFHYDAFKTIAELNLSEMNKELDHFLTKHPNFTEVLDIRILQNKAGLYLMVLDDYACCYIGQSKDIKKRIQQHWSKINFGTTGIDMFKALDTTRIYALTLGNTVTQKNIDKMEYQFIHAINQKYLLNCHGGGGSLEFIHSDSPELGYGCDPV